MYTQFFGNYLLNNGYITSEQLIKALGCQQQGYVKLGFLAIHSGYMTSNQVEEVHICQTHDDKKFGEIAIEKGYLTEEQVDELLETQTPDYLLFSQTLEDLGYMDSATFEEAFNGYRKKYQLSKDDFSHTENDKLLEVIYDHYDISESTLSKYFIQYLSLLFNNIIRFIGKDFTPHMAQKLECMPEGHCAYQTILANRPITSYYSSDDNTLLSFASRYAQEEFPEIDEYVEASVEDFLNLHNGLFITTMSNEYKIEMTLEPPVTDRNFKLRSNADYYIIPITFSFGTVNFIFEHLVP